MRSWFWLASAAAVGLFPLSASAILVYDQPTGNTTAPADDRGWSLIGSLSGFAAVPVSDRHILTARHTVAGESQPVPSSRTFTAADGTAYTASKPVEFTVDGQRVDLVLWELSGTVEAWAQLYEGTPQPDQAVTLFGRGRSTHGAAIHDADDDLVGWDWGASQGLSWGENEVIGYYAGRQTRLVIDFDASSNQGIFTAGDSSGAVFTYDALAAQWQLLGVAEAVAPDAYWRNEEDGSYTRITNAAIFDASDLYLRTGEDEYSSVGNSVYQQQLGIFVNLAEPDLRSQILAAIPEPASVALLGLGMATLCGRRR